MLHEDLTARIVRICFDVINELGSGFVESVYQKAVLIALRQAGLKVSEQVRLEVQFRGKIVGLFYADLVVEEIVLVELKAVDALIRLHKAQVINYLKAARLEVGLLINFGRPKIEVKRLHNQESFPSSPSC